MNKIVVSFLMVLSLAGCDSANLAESQPQVAVLGEPFEIDYNQKAIFQDQDITIKFVGVLEDSRCPVEAECIWAGNVKIALLFNGQQIKLNSNLKPRQIAVRGYVVKLVSVLPSPHVNEKIKKEKYTAKLLVLQK